MTKYVVTFFFLMNLVQETKLISQTKLYTRTGKIVFFSKAPIEDIKAVNNQASCIYEIETNRLIANVLIKAFEFEKTLMQQHFNENYIESDKFPKAVFKGKLKDIEGLNFNSNWSKNIPFEGDLTIHGITNKISSTAQLNNNNRTLTVNAEFYILLKDYDIKIPSTVINNISEKIQVKVNFVMSELKK